MPPEDPAEVASPGRYLERIEVASGKVIAGEIEPQELLIVSHRDDHPVEIHAGYMASRMIRATGSEEAALSKLLRMRALGRRVAGGVARWIGKKDPEPVAAALFGLHAHQEGFRFKSPSMAADQRRQKVRAHRHEADLRLRELVPGKGLRLLLTGGTGFIGKELLAQLARDDGVAEIVVLIRPKILYDRKTGEVLETLGAEERGSQLLDQLRLPAGEGRERFRFLEGDVEKAGFGLGGQQIEALADRLTHVIHCAASVAFDSPYEESFRANVLGTLQALRFSHRLQNRPQSPFVAHLAVETSYIHGRQRRELVREDELVFPRNYYNNYYELTKAMASLETERFMLEKDLRVVQLCPSIVIGEADTGNNRGDTKVVNAPINVFGRVGTAPPPSWAQLPKSLLMSRLARVFPGDPTAQINLISVDRVASGILAALRRPQAVGERVHLANDRRIAAGEIARIVREELGVEVKLVDPTLHRTVGLPLVRRLLKRLGQDRIARVLDRMNAVFSGYAEWGQPVHEVGHDVTLLGLSPTRPDPEHSFRMLCRHNRYVQDFGQIRDLDEISRREHRWQLFLEGLEKRLGIPAAELPADRFRKEVETGPDPYRPASSPWTGRRHHP